MRANLRYRHRISRGFTLIELMVVIGMVAVLLALILVSVQSIRATSNATQCTNNLAQIGLALQNFRTLDAIPPKATVLQSKLAPYLEGQPDSITKCPDSDTSFSYGANFCFERFQPSDNKIVFIDATQADVQFIGANDAVFRATAASRHKGVNALFFDGRVTRYSVDAINPYDPVAGSSNVTQFWEPEQKGCENCGGGYFTGVYYNNSSFSGGATPPRKETTLHLPFGGPDFFGVAYNSPYDPTGQTSAKYTGRIRVDRTDSYTFWITCDNDAWFYLDGQLLLYRQAGNGGFCSTCVQFAQPVGPMVLQAGQMLNFEVRTANYGGPAHLSVQWSSTQNPAPTTIPAANLYP